MNLLIKKVKRVGHGFRNFANYRLRLLLHCGVAWQTRRTASLRAAHHAWWRRGELDLPPGRVRRAGAWWPRRACVGANYGRLRMRGRRGWRE
jgi:hypothetical protein